MIHSEKPSLSVCAFSAGAVHAAVLALVLPVMITLPAANDRAQGTVAIQVAVLTAPQDIAKDSIAEASIAEASIAEATIAEAAMPDGDEAGEGDVDDAAWNSLAPEEVTGALPEASEQAALSPPVEADMPAALPAEALVESVPAPAPEEDVEPDAVASIEPAQSSGAWEAGEASEAPITVPMPLRKPHVSTAAVDTTAAVDSGRPAPSRPVTISKPRARASGNSQQPAFKGLLGGRRATSMEEYRLPGG